MNLLVNKSLLRMDKMETLLQFDQYYRNVKAKFEQELLFISIHIFYDYHLKFGKSLTNKKLHCLLFLVNAKRYEENLGFYKNDEIPEFERLTLGYDAWNRGPIQTYIQQVIQKNKPEDIITVIDLKMMQAAFKSEESMPPIKNLITDVVDRFGRKRDVELAQMIATFLEQEHNNKRLRSFRKSKLRFEV